MLSAASTSYTSYPTGHAPAHAPGPAPPTLHSSSSSSPDLVPCSAETLQTAPINGNAAAASAPAPEIDIVINNVVCSFSVRCHLNLRDIALKGVNVEYRKENGVRAPQSSLLINCLYLSTHSIISVEPRCYG